MSGTGAKPAATYHIYVAASSFCLALYAFSLARLHAVWFDPRFALVALGVCAAGMAFGAAFAQVQLARRIATAWFGASASFAALALAALTLLTFGPALPYLLATGLLALPFAAWVVGISCIAGSPSSDTWIRGFIATLGALAAALTSYWLFDLSASPLLIAALATGALSAVAILITPRSALVLPVITLGLLATIGFASDWWSSPSLQWKHSMGSPLTKTAVRFAADSPSVWGPFSRVELGHIGNDLSIHVSGTFRGLIPLSGTDGDDDASLEERFPLVFLPLRAGRPARILLVNPHGAIELRMALRQQVSQIHVFERPDAVQALALAQPYTGDLLGPKGVVVTHGTKAPPWRPVELDQVYLTIPHPHPSGWTDIDPAQNFLFTVEAFREHWGRLKAGGTMIVLAGEPTLFVRAFLQAWEALPSTYRERRPIAAQSWGYRRLGAQPGQQPYEYLAVIAKGPTSPDFARRLMAIAKEMPLVPLFGPGIAPGVMYSALTHPAGVPAALPALGQHLVRQQNLLVDIFPATDDRPFFFQPIRDLHPYLKWLVGAGLVVLGYTFLFPLAPLRRVETPDNARRLPIPLYLAVFAVGTAAWTATVVSVLWQGMRYSELSSLLVITTMAVLLGAVAGSLMNARWRKTPDATFWGRAAAALAAVVTLTGAFASVIAPRWAQTSPELYVAATGLLLFTGSAFAVPSVLAGMRYCRQTIAGVSPWLWAIIGCGALLGAVQPLWIAQLQGWRTAWIAQVGMVSGAAILVLLLSRSCVQVTSAAGKSRARR